MSNSITAVEASFGNWIEFAGAGRVDLLAYSIILEGMKLRFRGDQDACFQIRELDGEEYGNF